MTKILFTTMCVLHIIKVNSIFLNQFIHYIVIVWWYWIYFLIQRFLLKMLVSSYKRNKFLLLLMKFLNLLLVIVLLLSISEAKKLWWRENLQVVDGSPMDNPALKAENAKMEWVVIITNVIIKDVDDATVEFVVIWQDK